MKIFIYIDNSLFGRITTDYKKYITFYESLKVRELPNLETYTSIVSPSSICEALGITLKEVVSTKVPPSIIQKLRNEIKKKNNSEVNSYVERMNDLRVSLFDGYYAQIKMLDTFQKDNFINALEIKLNYVADDIKVFFKDHFEASIDSEYEIETIVAWLAHDRTQSHPLKIDIETDYCSSLMVDIGQFLDDDRNNPFARTVQRVWSDFLNKFVPAGTKTDNRTYEQLKNDFDFITDAISFHGAGDLMDIEIVNYSITGRFSDGKRCPVYCFTCDKEEDVITRIALAKSILKNALEMYTSATEIEIHGTLKHGKIIFCDYDGHIKSILCITEDIPNLLDFIQDNSWQDWLKDFLKR